MNIHRHDKDTDTDMYSVIDEVIEDITHATGCKECEDFVTVYMSGGYYMVLNRTEVNRIKEVLDERSA